MLAGGLLALVGAGLLSGPAGAAPVTGCQGTAQSFDGSNQSVDLVSGPGTGGTKSDPFTIDRDGHVKYSGSSTDVLQNGKWAVDVGVMLDISGKVTNAAGTREWAGDEKVSDRLPFNAPGLYRVAFTVTGAAGTPCTGSVWIEIKGNPLTSPLFLGGALFLVVGTWELVATLAHLVNR
jgi:hypothetical protein